MRSSAANRSRSCLHSVLAAAVILALSGPAVAQAQPATAPVAAASVADFDIPAQPLDTALTRLADQGSVRILFVSDEVAGVEAKGIAGRYTAEQALTRLLDGTNLAWRWREPGIVVVAPAAGQAKTGQGAVVTDSLNVGARALDEATGARRDIRGHDDVYDLDLSTAYIGRAEIERYKGTTPSDLLNGVPGVFSGDARNSGALDVNIRGIQGPGRVPVTIDGSEQALTVWRGYNGATNRNYIDPNLIGGIQIIKGPALVRNVNTGIGGAMVINTLDVDDFVPEGERYGGEVKLEGSSNSVDPRLPTLHTGEDYRDVEGFPQIPGAPYTDPTLVVTPKSGGGGYNVFAGEDYAWRAAFGWRPADSVDLLAAYAYRERGNYFSGQHNAGYYSHERSSSVEDYISSMANYWRPGDEVPNTSSQMESWLFKATWRPSDDQALQFAYRDSLSHYGEILPSRIIESDERGAIQWPLSRVDAQAYNLEYKWQPEGSRWVDLYANLWRTDTLSDTYTAGGFPNYAQGDPEWGYDPILKNTALANATNTRNGVTLSNKIRFTDSLDLTIGGNFQHEKLRSDDVVSPTDGWRMLPRAGRRQEWNASFDFEWRPLDFLTLNAGARYVSYWAFDDYVAAHEGELSASAAVSRVAEYRTRYEETYSYEITYDDVAQSIADLEAQRWLLELLGYDVDAMIQPILDSIGTHTDTRTVTETHEIPWEPDADGNYSRATNPCLNGQFLQDVGDATPIPLADANDEIYCQTSPVNQYVSAKAKKKRDHGWVPSFSATVHFNDDSRAYFRYSEMLRYPSMFESTLGFSASINPFRDLKPEHAYDWEVAYVHDLSRLLKADRHADVKLAYYVHKNRDEIERDTQLNFSNIDKHTIRGLEFSGRYDGGRLFTDLSVNYVLENKVCDENMALLLSVQNGERVGLDGKTSIPFVPNCVKYGFPNGYLLTQASPELSAAWSLGGRFLDGRLEIGGRAVYFKQYKNADLDWYRGHASRIEDGQSVGNLVYFYNVPFSWGEVLTFDAYASYRIKENLSLELVGTNLTNQYYVDPVTRSAMAAPGRTLKLSLTARF